MPEDRSSQSLSARHPADNGRQLHYLNKLLSAALHVHPEPNSALRTILKSAAKALGAQRCAYWLVHSNPAQTRCMLAYDDVKQNFDADLDDASAVLSLHGLLRLAASGGNVLAADDVDRDPRTALACEYFHACQVKSAMLVPARQDGNTSGVLVLSQLHEPRTWRKDETELIGSAAALVARLYEKPERTRNEPATGSHRDSDSVTGLPGMDALMKRSAEFFPRVTAGSPAAAVFLIDADGFRGINEQHGHAVGDQLLRTMALRLKNVVRKDDLLVRAAGDRFLLLARKLSDARVADDIGQEIVDVLQGTYSLKGCEVQASASAGVALYPLDGSDFDTLHKHAQIALAHAKSGGRNCFRMYSPRLAHRLESKSVLEAELRRAIREGELQHFYLPQVDLHTGTIHCVEALLRWRHPQHGLLLPAAFLPTAEEYGLMQHISAWVLRDACEQLRIWEERGHERMHIAVNLSTAQITDERLLQTLEDALDRSGILPSRLELEISESTAMRRDVMSASVLERITEMAIGLSIDDFGTGYSNMAYLRRYPVQKVKIDRSLVSGLPAASDERAVTDAIISMAQPLGLDVVAEGVETQEQLDYLRNHGCDIAQGYYFTQPLTADQFETWLVRH
jgi:diguanylate cyclase (GGDEF)-like protein